MRRWLFTIVSVLSLLLCVATAAMWWRSLRALDQWYGSVRGVYFEADSCNGRLQGQTRRRYRVRQGVDADIDVILAATRPFDSLEEWADPHRGHDNFVTRQRWPLRQTMEWDPQAPAFPGPHFDRSLGWARDGPGRYDWVTSFTAPYWLAVLAFGLMPALWVAKAARRLCTKKPAGSCRSCGYDLRATPGLCPECGTPSAKAEEAPLPAAHKALPSSSKMSTLDVGVRLVEAAERA